MPTDVWTEVNRRGPDDATGRAIRAASWLEVVPAPEVPEAVRAWGLGPGESAVLAHALMGRDVDVVLDDRQARRCARVLGVDFLGTLSLVLRAKELGLIPLARPVLERLRAEGMYLSDVILKQALAEVGE